MGLRNKGAYYNENCFFVTTTCLNWHPLILDSDSYVTLENSLDFCNKSYESDILA